MSNKSFEIRRISGFFVATSGLLFALSNLLRFQSIIIPIFLAMALILIQVFNDSPRIWMGWIGVVISILGIVAMQFDLLPILSNVIDDQLIILILLFIVFSIGNILLGISINRSGSYERFTGTALVLSPIFIVFTGSNLLYSLTLIWIGIQLIRGKSVVASELKPEVINDNDLAN